MFEKSNIPGFSVFERKMRVCIPFQKKPPSDQLDCPVQAEAQERAVCKYVIICVFSLWKWKKVIPT